ncbi:MAG: threonine--tRNA ligase [Candidatus Sungbacteria bacterium]|uniref:Threonine--tRNA ligase n=1 Tax=Candidatus Sungiibacteriota bacterium TaxID=2750080 RepID=A0A9D6LTL4_9BACT|nr:threonine--tRNA ligase [Candidatus Sungbacteria bacterium]
MSNDESLENLRHSLAHLLAAAVLELWPNAKPTIGPAIENGFYYDFQFVQPISENDLPKIEAKMREMLGSWGGITGKEVSAEEAKEFFKGNLFKLELIDEIVSRGEPITLYTSGNFIDLCRGGHVENIKDINPEAFKLTKVAGAYWRGSEKNPQLTRIYGVAFETPEELKKYLTILEEAEKRDHRKLGRDLELFMFHETAPGMPYWLPKGLIVINQLIHFWRTEHQKRGYQEIKSPLLNKKELYTTSGHWDHYLENMFISETAEGETYALKPMNCPNAMVVFDSKLRSYRDLPLRLSDTDTLHRFERSGTLSGLLRVREFSQDDAHIFIAEDQIHSEYQEIFSIAERFYSVFNLEYSFQLGTRPEKFIGEKSTWDNAEKQLKDILAHSGKSFSIAQGEGAFYGPKIDILMKDSLGRDWQTGTIQLDFQLPQRFDLRYVSADGTPKTPIVIHRVIYGSLERFLGILIEHTAGVFPFWLAPVQVAILPINDKNADYIEKVATQLAEKNIRHHTDSRNESISRKIRDAELEKIPYLFVIGDREAETGKVAVRQRGKGDLGAKTIEEFLGQVL